MSGRAVTLFHDCDPSTEVTWHLESFLSLKLFAKKLDPRESHPGTVTPAHREIAAELDDGRSP
jgi:hypothetical protein